MYSPPHASSLPSIWTGWRSHGVARYCMSTPFPANSSVRMKPTRSSQRRTRGARLTNTQSRGREIPDYQPTRLRGSRDTR